MLALRKALAVLRIITLYRCPRSSGTSSRARVRPKKLFRPVAVTVASISPCTTTPPARTCRVAAAAAGLPGSVTLLQGERASDACSRPLLAGGYPGATQQAGRRLLQGCRAAQASMLRGLLLAA